MELYDIPAQSNRVIRPRSRKSLETKSGVRMELPSTSTKMLESMLIRVPPGTGSYGTYQRQGEDFLYMLEGALEVWLNEIECHRWSRVTASGSKAIVAAAGLTRPTNRQPFSGKILH